MAEIDIAKRTAGWYVMYEYEYNECRDRWLAFIDDPDASTDSFNETLTGIAEYLNDDDQTDYVPEEHRGDVIVASFYGAAADAALSDREVVLEHTIGELRKVVNQLW